MPDTVPHLGVLDRYYDPFRVVQDMSILPSAGREADVPSFGFDCLAVGVGFEMASVLLGTFFLVADRVAIGIVRFCFHVTPRITGLPTEATPSKSYSA